MWGALAAGVVVLRVVGCILPSWAREVNITIDDTFGDPTTGQIPSYDPAAHPKLQARSGQAACDGCRLGLDASQVYKSTWHDLTSTETASSNLSFQFRGTAVYVYFILANGIQDADIHMSFFMDGQLVGTFTDIGNRSTEAPAFRYHQVVYTSGNLSNAVHSFVLSSAPRCAGGSVVLFDYAVYTAQDEPSPDTSVRERAANFTRDTHAASVFAPTEDEIPHTSSSFLASSIAYGSPDHDGSPRMEDLSTRPVPQPSADHPVTIGLIIVSIAAALAYLAGLFWYCNRRRKKQESQMRQLEPQPLNLPSLSSPATAYHLDSTVRPYPRFIPPALGMLAAASAVQSYGHAAVARSAGLTPGVAAAISMSSVAAKYASISKGRAVLPQPDAPAGHNSQLHEELAQLREEMEILRARDDPPPGYYDTLTPGPS